jgi:hypothetical protein
MLRADSQRSARTALLMIQVVERLNETLDRSRVLFMQRERWTTPERVESIRAGVNPLRSTRPAPFEEVRALAFLAFSGWCWREAERGDPTPIREQILAAYRAALAEPGVDGPLLPAWAGWKFREDGGEPGLASPGETRERRLEFLDAAFEKMCGHWGVPVRIPKDKSRMAFVHGVCVSDVERLALGRHLPFA